MYLSKHGIHIYYYKLDVVCGFTTIKPAKLCPFFASFNFYKTHKFSFQVWFKNRRAKCRQQQKQHNQQQSVDKTTKLKTKPATVLTKSSPTPASINNNNTSTRLFQKNIIFLFEIFNLQLICQFTKCIRGAPCQRQSKLCEAPGSCFYRYNKLSNGKQQKQQSSGLQSTYF